MKVVYLNDIKKALGDKSSIDKARSYNAWTDLHRSK